MSQAKVDRYKEEKARRKEIIATEKRKHFLSVVCLWIVLIAIVGWAGYSIYHNYERNKPVETIYTDLTSISDYMNALNGGNAEEDADAEEAVE